MIHTASHGAIGKSHEWMDTQRHWLFEGEEDVEGAVGQGQEEVQRRMC